MKYYAKKNPFPKVAVAAWDTETTGLGGDVTFASWSHADGETGYATGDSLAIMIEVLNALKENPYTHNRRKKTGSATVVYAHNAQYDWRLLFKYAPELERAGFKMSIGMRTANSVFELTLEYPDKTLVVLRDSFALFSRSLKDLTGSFGDEGFKKLNGPDFAGGVVFDPDNADHRRYAIRDADALRRAMINFQDEIHRQFGTGLGPTISSTALMAWQQTLGPREKYFSLSDVEEKTCRSAYYGGFVFLTRDDQLGPCTTLDVSSSYPAQMKKGVPGGNAYRIDHYVDSTVRPGFFDVTVEAPADIIVPILPTRVGGHTRFPAGRFRTCCSNLEIDFALEHGYRLLDFHGGLIFTDLIFPFTKFVDKCEGLRKRFKGTPTEMVIKLIQNSVYGKFATSRDRVQYAFGVEPPDRAPDGSTRWVDPTEPTSESNGLIWTADEHQDDIDMVCRPDWAAWITANARLTLLRAIYAIGPECCVYGDTDSITVVDALTNGRERQILEIGPEYGKFQLDKEWRSFRAAAPKNYAGMKWDKKSKDFVWSGAAKGLPKKRMRDEEWRMMFEKIDFKVDYTSLPSLIVAIKRGMSEAAPCSRRCTDLHNSANWMSYDDGRVRPRRVDVTDFDSGYSGLSDRPDHAARARAAERGNAECDRDAPVAAPQTSRTEIQTGFAA